jgi:hypothetical protein
VHTNLVTVLDRHGEIIHQQNDFSSNSGPVLEVIRQQGAR